MNIFDYSSYKSFVKDHVNSLPRGGRGELSRIAKAISVHTSSLSQVLNAEKDLTMDQSLSLSEYLGLNSRETDYFVLLVNKSRASTGKAKNYFQTRMNDLKQSDVELAVLLDQPKEVHNSLKSVYYSSWLYSGARILSSISNYQNIEELSKRLGIEKSKCNEIVDFLIEAGVCKKMTNRIIANPEHTHISTKAHEIDQHRRNWRIKALERLDQISNGEYALSAPMSVSQNDLYAIKEELQILTKKILDRCRASKSEVPVCLNIDWVQF